MSIPTSTLTEPITPNPPRFWWLKRLSIAIALVLLALVALRWVWGREAWKQRWQIIDAAHARHEPILPADFATPSIPDSQNAAFSLQSAANTFVADPNSDYMDTNWKGWLLTPAEVARVDVIAANNAGPLQLVRLARSQPRADWGLIIDDSVSTNLPLAHLNRQRQLANLQKWVALRDHAKGNDGEAMEHVLDTLRHARALEQGPTFQVTHLSVIAMESLATDLIQRITPDLKVASESSSHVSSGGPAEPALVRAVIAQLLDEPDLREGELRALDGERLIALNATNLLARGRSPWMPAALSWILAPMYVLDGNRVAQDLSNAKAAAAVPDWPAASAVLGKTAPAPPSDIEGFTALLSSLYGGRQDRAIQINFQMIAERRAAAIVLAIKLYRDDHANRLPSQLSELVPNYLPAVPMDPMAADGKVFGYHSDSKPPVIYSVGYDGVDNGGTSLPDEWAGKYRWKQPDAVYPLEPVAPATSPASAETQNNQ